MSLRRSATIRHGAGPSLRACADPQQHSRSPSPGWSPPPPAARPPARSRTPGTATHTIAEVQGTGDATPLNGTTVTVEGVVTGDFQNADQLKGYFLQSTTPDGDPRTSEGLFAYSTVPVKEGDRVLVTGGSGIPTPAPTRSRSR